MKHIILFVFFCATVAGILTIAAVNIFDNDNRHQYRHFRRHVEVAMEQCESMAEVDEVIAKTWAIDHPAEPLPEDLVHEILMAYK